MIRRIATAAVLLTLLAAGRAHAGHHPDIEIGDPWSRPLPPVAPNGAAYLTVTNHTDRPDRLLSASSPIASRVELHTHIEEGGVARMRRVDAAEVPAGGSVALRPGGLHVMLIGLERSLDAGLVYPLTLRFEHAGTIEVEVVVKPPDASAGDPGRSHQHMKH